MVEALLSRLRHYCHTVLIDATRATRLKGKPWIKILLTRPSTSGKTLDAYRKTPGTMGIVRRPDRLPAAQLHQRRVRLAVVENALVLAAARRLIRPTDAPPLGTIHSLAYFLPVIDEVLGLRVNPDYFRYLRQKIERTTQTR